MITEQQKNNIHKLSIDDCIDIMHECKERIGLVSVDECSIILSISRRSVYDMMKSGKLKYFIINNRYFPIINK